MDTPHAYILSNTKLYSVLYTALYTEHSIATLCSLLNHIQYPVLYTRFDTVLYTRFDTVLYTTFYTVLFTVLYTTVSTKAKVTG